MLLQFDEHFWSPDLLSGNKQAIMSYSYIGSKDNMLGPCTYRSFLEYVVLTLRLTRFNMSFVFYPKSPLIPYSTDSV